HAGHTMRPAHLAFGLAVLGLALAACTRPVVQPAAQQPVAQQPVQSAAEQPVQPARNPPGDIPDDQAFITFSSPTGGYQVQVPEGWARTGSGDSVRFVAKFGGFKATLTRATQ